MLLVNAQAEELFGYRHEELIGETLELLEGPRRPDVSSKLAG